MSEAPIDFRIAAAADQAIRAMHRAMVNAMALAAVPRRVPAPRTLADYAIHPMRHELRIRYTAAALEAMYGPTAILHPDHPDSLYFPATLQPPVSFLRNFWTNAADN